MSNELNNKTNNPETPATQSSDQNQLFFEKFEKTKKDFSKARKEEKKQAQRKINASRKLLSFENKLRDKRFLWKIWLTMFAVGGLFLAYNIVVFTFLSDKFNGTADLQWTFANFYGDFTKTAVVFAGVVISLLPLPYLFLFTSWFISINNVLQNKYFVLTNLSFLLIAAILSFFVIVFSSLIFAQVDRFTPIV